MISFDGQPIPAGMIRFSPDFKKGNRGPGTYAEIKSGYYTTRLTNGVVGGPMVLEILGYDGVPVVVNDELLHSGKSLFAPQSIEVDLPRETAEWNFDIPRPKVK